MRSIILKSSFLLSFFLINLATQAQCAMCRASLENNVSNGNTGIAAGINMGILYLFFTPYVLAGIIAYFWYKNSKVNARKELLKRTITR